MTDMGGEDQGSFGASAPSCGSPALRKPAYGAACNGCGLCCTAVPCGLAMAFVRDVVESAPCPALEWSEGRSWCGLIRNPAKHVKPLLWLSIRHQAADFQASVASDLLSGRCDSGAPDGVGEDEFLGWTANDFLTHAAETGLRFTSDGVDQNEAREGERSEVRANQKTPTPNPLEQS